MGLGSTAKTIQRVADMGEKVYSRLNDVRDQLTELRSTVQTTDERVAQLEFELVEQRAILDAVAEQQGVDVESVIAESHIDEAEGVDQAPATADAADSPSSTVADDTSNSSSTAADDAAEGDSEERLE